MRPEISRGDFFKEAGKWTSRVGAAGLFLTTGKALWDAKSLLNAQNAVKEDPSQRLTAMARLTQEIQHIHAANEQATPQVDIDIASGTISSAVIVVGTIMKALSSDIK